MPESSVVIAFKTTQELQTAINNFFGGDADVIFLAGLSAPGREQAVARARAVIAWNLPKELLPAELALINKDALVQLLSAGADQVPFEQIRPEITVASNAGAYAEPIAEHVLAMALALSKNLLREHRNMERGVFNMAGLNRMLRGKTCGIIGFGGIGKATARLMTAMGLRIQAVNSSGSTGEPVDFIGALAELGKVLAAADVIVVSLPLTKSTRGLIGKQQLEAMKPDAILINVARGAVIDEQALYEHLVSRPDFRVGLDTWWIEPFNRGEFRTNYPFLSLPNVIGSPHNSAVVPGMNEEGSRRAVLNVKRWLRGEPVSGVIKREEYM